MHSNSRGAALWLAAAAFAALMMLAAPAAMAQSQNISGTVVDASGGVIPGAQVTITDADKGTVARVALTDDAGRFQALNLQPANYLIAVEMAGFKKAQVPAKLDVNTKLDVGQIRMEVGQVSETVEITEAIPAVQTTTMEKAYLVEQKQILELPLNGRNWISLMSNVPGVNSGARSDFDMNFNDVSAFHANGGRGSQNNFYLDGSPNLDVGDNQSQYTQPSIDSIAEFKVQQSTFNAEYGRNSGMVVAVQTKAGSSSYHGTLYEYVRNDALDAKNTGLSATAIKDKLRYNQFGGNVSGWVPLPKISTASEKKLFFFYNREMTRRQIAAAGTKYTDIPNPDILLNGDFRPWLLPTDMQYAPQFKNGTIFQPGTIVRNGAGFITDGVPFANNTVPKSMWASKSSALLKMWTSVPNYSSLPDAPNAGYKRYYWTAPNTLHKDQDLLRIDYSVSSRMNTYFRWVNDYQKETIATGIWGSQPLPLMPMFRPKPGSSWSWNVVTTFTPKLASETILAYNHQSQELGIVDRDAVDRDKLGANWTQLYPAANTANIPQDVTTGIINVSWGAPGWHNDGKDYAFTENMTWVNGSHVFKFGFHYNRDNKKQTGTWGMQGSINFSTSSALPQDTGNGIANLMLGNFRTFTMPNAHVYPYFRFQSWEGFAQDSWKITPRFTVEYGVRLQRSTPTYSYTREGSPPLEGTWKIWSVDLSKYDPKLAPYINVANGQIVGDAYSQLSKVGLVCDPCDGVPRGFAPAETMLAPRLGFAYDLFGDAKTSLRGGFGVFIERLRQNNFYFSAGGHWPNTSGATQQNGNVNSIDMSVIQGTPAITPPGFVIYPKSNTMPSIYSWNLGIQRQFPQQFTLDLSYVGNRGTHLMIHRAINGVPGGTFVKYPDLQRAVNYRNDALRPYYGWGGLTSIETSGWSSYHGLLTRLGRRFSNRVAFNLNWTYSKSMNLVDNDSDGVRDPYNLRRNWAPAGYDMTHIVSIDYIWQLPGVSGRLDNLIMRAVLNGWQLSGITRFQSGRPLTVSSNGSTMGVDSGGMQPDLIGRPYEGRTQWRWLNPAAFRRPLDGEYGTVGRNSLRYPGNYNFDANISKTFRIMEGVNFDVRAEVYNLFNHPQIWGLVTGFSADNPGALISSSLRNFGQPNSWRDPRVIQFGFKLRF